MPMATTAHRATSKASSDRKGETVARSSSSGRFLSVASLKPVTKRATITSTQADKAVQDYLKSHKR